MKSIKLKIGKENIQGTDIAFGTIDVLKSAVNNIEKDQGLSVSEMSQRLRLLSILDKHNEFELGNKQVTESMLRLEGEAQFEDADFAKLKELFNNVKWTVVSKFIVDLSEEFNK